MSPKPATSSPTHPEWAAVGNTVRVLQKFRQSDTHIVYEHTAVVVRHTPTLIITDTGKKYRGLHLTPRYLNYVTHLAPADTDETKP